MPSDLHSRLMEPTGVHNYVEIPTLASWSGDVVKANQRLAMFRSSEAKKAIAQQFQGGLAVSPAAPTTRAQLKQMGFVAAVAAQQTHTGHQHGSHQPGGRVAGDLTNRYVVDAAIGRYQAGKLQAGEPNNQISKAILGSLLVDIYTVTGKFMATISRNPKLRTDDDCALFPFYRALHWAAADAFGKVFGVNGDEIDAHLNQQLIGMTSHGHTVDANVGREVHKDPVTGKKATRLVYLSDEEALACQLHVSGGKLMITNAHGVLEPFDCSGDEFKDRSRTQDGKNHTPKANTAFSGRENNGGKGVAGFAMGVNRNIYSSRHWNHAASKGSFYHSSYFGGSEVLCTGCITVVAGDLIYINNSSGHYRPEGRQLSPVLQALQAQGVNITNVTVDLKLDDGTFLKTKAPVLIKAAAEEGILFNIVSKESLPDFANIASRVRAALTAYEARSKGFFTSQSKKSKETLKTLKQIRDDEALVKEVQFRLQQVIKAWLPHIRPIASPLRTDPAEQYTVDGGELCVKLYEAILPLLGPPAKR